MAQLRFTGDWPPPEILEQIPNWVYASDEEGIDGQDETTLMPEGTQDVVTRDTICTAGEVTLACGERFVAVVMFLPPLRADLFDYFNGSEWVRSIRDHRTGRWQSFDQDWLPEGERMPTVAMGDTRIFPLRLRSRLALVNSGSPLDFKVNGDGSERHRTAA